MSYYVPQPGCPVAVAPAGLGYATASPASPVVWVVGGVVVIGVLGLILYSAKRQMDRMDIIAQKEGSSGVLKAQAGQAAIGIGSMVVADALTHRRNPRRGKRRRRA